MQSPVPVLLWPARKLLSNVTTGQHHLCRRVFTGWFLLSTLNLRGTSVSARRDCWLRAVCTPFQSNVQLESIIEESHSPPRRSWEALDDSSGDQLAEKLFCYETFQPANSTRISPWLLSDAFKPKLPGLGNRTTSPVIFLFSEKPFKMIKGISDLTSWAHLDLSCRSFQLVKLLWS